MDDLAEELYISRSSLTKDMQEIKERLIPYSLKSFLSMVKGHGSKGKKEIDGILSWILLETIMEIH